MSDCFICIEPLVNSVECPGCGYIACMRCVKRYILSQNKLVHCMNPSCYLLWTFKFLNDNFDEVWLNGSYCEHYKMIVLNRERTKIPETAAQIPRWKKELVQDKLFKDLQVQILTLQSQLNEARKNLQIFQDLKKKQLQSDDVLRFLCLCPYSDCRGMIDSTTCRCSLCGGGICRRCQSPATLEEKHECNEKDIETLALLHTDTKPCPKCFSAIHKIEGCDQMWCTQCHTPFSWNTGKIQTGVIHNPHAIRWQREHGVWHPSRGHILCGTLLQRLPNSQKRQKIQKIHRRIGELEEVLRHCTPRLNFDDLRKQLVLKEISEEKWKQDIFWRERENVRKQENHKIFRTLQTLATERFHELAHNIKGKPSRRYLDWTFDTFLLEMDEIRTLINRAFKDTLPPLGISNPLEIKDTWDRW